MSNQFLENSVNQLMKKRSLVDSTTVDYTQHQTGLLDGRIIVDPKIQIFDGRVESPRSIKIDIFDPLGRAGLIEENLRAVFRKFNSKGSSCFFSVGSSQNKMYMDSFQDLILFVNEKYALTNKDRFKLDRPNSDGDIADIADFLAATLETACFYKI